MNTTTYKVPPTKQVKVDNVPLKAMNLARRAVDLAGQGRGRYVVELLVTKDGRWIVVVDGGIPEDLGQ